MTNQKDLETAIRTCYGDTEYDQRLEDDSAAIMTATDSILDLLDVKNPSASQKEQLVSILADLYINTR